MGRVYKKSDFNPVVRIAASNTSTRARRQADYVCTGTNDHALINSVIAALGDNGGGQVQLEDGTYNIADSVLITKSNMSLRGRSRSTVLDVPWVRATPLANPVKAIGSVNGEVFLENIHISDLTLIGHANWAENATDPDGCIGIAYNTVYLQFVRHLLLENMHLERGGFTTDCRNVFDLHTRNISAYQASGPSSLQKVDGFTVIDSSGDDVKLIVDLGESLNGVITGMRGTGTTATSGQHVKAFDCGASNNVVVSDFHFRGFDGDGMHIKNENGKPSTNINISNGQIFDSSSSIFIDDSSAYANGKMGPISIDNVTIKTAAGAGAGITITGFDTGCTITNCDIVAKTGIEARSTTNTLIANNRVFATAGFGIRAGNFYGVDECTNLQIHHNIVSSAGAPTNANGSIYLLKCIRPKVSHNTIVASNFHGIWALSCSYPDINDNLIEAAFANGIFLQWQDTTYTDSTRRRLGFRCNRNRLSGFYNGGVSGSAGNSKGIGISVVGIAGAAYNDGQICDNIITGSGASAGAGVEIGIDIDGAITLDRIQILNNTLQYISIHSFYRRSTIVLGTGCKIRGNLGYVTDARGTATVLAGNTSVVVTHGLASNPTSPAPTVDNFAVTPSTLGNATTWRVSAVTATTFTITVDVAPGGAGATFAWQAQMF